MRRRPREIFTEEVEKIRSRYAVILVSACTLLLSIGNLRLVAQTIKFEVPAVVDPIHTNGEPDIAIDPSRRVFVSGPTGTGTQARLPSTLLGRQRGLPRSPCWGGMASTSDRAS